MTPNARARSRSNGYLLTMVSLTFKGIPCIIGITEYPIAEAATMDCPGDYTGPVYEVVDRRGYPAEWLKRKMEADSAALQEMEDRLCEKLHSQFQSDYDDHRADIAAERAYDYY